MCELGTLGWGVVGKMVLHIQMFRNPMLAQNTFSYLPFEKGALLLDTPLKSLKICSISSTSPP